MLAVDPRSGRVASEAYGAEHLPEKQVLTEAEETAASSHEAIKELVAAKGVVSLGSAVRGVAG